MTHSEKTLDENQLRLLKEKEDLELLIAKNKKELESSVNEILIKSLFDKLIDL